jgi:hypothetical protein
MPFDNPPQPRQEITLLRAARDRITGPTRWAKRCYVQPPTGVCAIQAVKIVCNGRGRMMGKLSRALARELPKNYRWLFFLPPLSKVILYNDRGSTTHQMVIELFDAAIMRLELESV